MAAVLSLLIIVSLSILVNRIATIILVHTGMSRESARFQARSAFTTVGFTTQETEQVVNHPVRRKIVMWLMLFGHAGFVTVVSSLILTFIKTDEGSSSTLVRLASLAGGLVLLWALSMSRWVDRWLSRVISWALKKWTTLDVRDYSSLLRLSGNYQVMEMNVHPEDSIVDRSLVNLDLRKNGVMVLGIQRADGSYVGAPDGNTVIHANDQLILYGPEQNIRKLDEQSS